MVEKLGDGDPEARNKVGFFNSSLGPTLYNNGIEAFRKTQ